MGLISSLNNAMSGLRVNQDSLAVVSRNIANSGTPGYHRQTLNILDHTSGDSSYARSIGVQRAFDKSLQTYYNRQVSDAAQANTKAHYLEQLQTYLGKPGSAGSLDKSFQDLEAALSGLATSPDDHTARASALASAQSMAETLNRLSLNIQGLRQQAEDQIAHAVSGLNSMLSSLEEVNMRLLDSGSDAGARAQLMDQRDRLVAGIAEKIDISVDYRANGTVALMSRSGVGLLDGGAARFGFESAGLLGATSQFHADPALSKVGALTITTPTGSTLDMLRHGLTSGGELGALLELRDKTLVEAQAQLDEIAAALAQAFGTERVEGQPVAGGFAVELGAMQPGNEMAIRYTEGGVSHAVRVVNTTEAIDYRDASGARVIGVDMSQAPTDIAAALGGLVPQLSFAADPPSGIAVLGGAGAVDSVLARPTATAGQGGGLALNLFVDAGGQGFTNNPDTNPPQKLGFAARIAINPAIAADNRLLVQHQVGGTLGDSARPDYFLSQLSSMQFVSGGDPAAQTGRFQLSGTVGQLISQTISFQGGAIASELARRDDKLLGLETVTMQMEAQYGVDVNEEMARLIELQNAYAANARVISVVQDLLNELLRL